MKLAAADAGTSAQISAIGIHDEAFLVTSMIERCPRSMMLRELVVNALEAAASDASGRGLVRLSRQVIDGVGKLAIWNNGVGLDAGELDRICDLASSLRKVTGLDQNFGMGAKVASLPSNKRGLRYRSCRAGQVSEVTLGQREGVYGRFLRAGEHGPETVADVTAACLAAGIETERDWTEVVLFGNRIGQDTGLDPYDGNPAMEADWLQATLRARFYRLPAGIDVALDGTLFRDGVSRPLEPYAQDERAGGRRETVRLPSGVEIAYRFDPPLAGEREAGVAGPGMACVVHKSEIYDLVAGRQWIVDSPLCGIAFAAKFISVHVLLPDDYPVRPEAYREFLRFFGGDQRQVGVRDFGRAVRGAMPLWLQNVIQSFGPRAVDFLGDVDREMRALIAELGLLPEEGSRGGPEREGAESKPADPVDLPLEERPEAAVAPAPPAYASPPVVVALIDPEQIADRELVEWAARYYAATNQLFVNLRYPAVGALSAKLQAGFVPEGLGPETVVALADAVAEWAVVRKVARATIFSLGKRRGTWPTVAIERALTVEALSIAAEDHDDRFEMLCERLRERAALLR